MLFLWFSYGFHEDPGLSQLEAWSPGALPWSPGQVPPMAHANRSVVKRAEIPESHATVERQGSHRKTIGKCWFNSGLLENNRKTIGKW